MKKCLLIVCLIFSLIETFNSDVIASEWKEISNDNIQKLKLKVYLNSSFKNIDVLIDKVLKRSLFGKTPDMYKKLKISILLNTLNSLKVKKKLDSELPTVILWKLPKSMSGYVRVLLKEFYTEIKLEIMDCSRMVQLDDSILENLLRSEDADSYEEQY